MKKILRLIARQGGLCICGGKRIQPWNQYSVMQSDGNNFCGEVVSDSFNKTSRDEDNILEQIFKSKYIALKPNFMSSSLLCAVFLLICIFFDNL